MKKHLTQKAKIFKFIFNQQRQNIFKIFNFSPLSNRHFEAHFSFLLSSSIGVVTDNIQLGQVFLDETVHFIHQDVLVLAE